MGAWGAHACRGVWGDVGLLGGRLCWSKCCWRGGVSGRTDAGRSPTRLGRPTCSRRFRPSPFFTADARKSAQLEPSLEGATPTAARSPTTRPPPLSQPSHTSCPHERFAPAATFSSGAFGSEHSQRSIQRLRLSPDHRPRQLDFLAVAQGLHAQLLHRRFWPRRSRISSGSTARCYGIRRRPHRVHLARSRPLLAYHKPRWTSQSFSTADTQLRRTRNQLLDLKRTPGALRALGIGWERAYFSGPALKADEAEAGWGPTGASRQS